jgi:hypothetical protein
MGSLTPLGKAVKRDQAELRGFSGAPRLNRIRIVQASCPGQLVLFVGARFSLPVSLVIALWQQADLLPM